MPLIIALKTKYFKINIMKYVQDLYTQNYKKSGKRN